MADRKLTNVQAFGTKPKRVDLIIYPDAGNAPTWTSTGGVASVDFTATGKYTITLQDTYRKLRAFHATYGTSADNVDLYAQAGAVANVGTTSAVTAIVKLKTGANNTNAAAAATDNRISVTLEFEDSDAFGT